MTPIGSVVIAAHDEEAVIGRTLRLLADVVRVGLLDVVVVCNGCSDSTAAIARGFTGVRVLETPVPSKALALRAGDRAALPGPRIYLDADVELTGRAALDTLRALGDGALAGRPPHRFDARGASWVVRRWYAVRQRLPSIQGALWGAGCYALSVAGRSRFADFPEVVADDLVIDHLFRRDEVTIVATDPVVVRTPRRTADLLRILRRSYRSQQPAAAAAAGGRQDPSPHGRRGHVRDLRALLVRHPRHALDVALYVAVVAGARIGARMSPQERWERDDSSRTPA